jgi:hypothetical protein
MKCVGSKEAAGSKDDFERKSKLTGFCLIFIEPFLMSALRAMSAAFIAEIL